MGTVSMRIVAVLFFALISLNLFSDDLMQIRNVLSKNTSVAGLFKQVKMLKELDFQLTSTGEFSYKNGVSLNWQQQKPFVMTIVMTPEKIEQLSADGVKSILTKSEQPGLFSMSASFLAVLSGNSSLEKDFSIVESKMQSKTWVLNLVPKDDILKKVIKQLRLSGSDFIEVVDIEEHSGNKTTIQFFNVKGLK